MPVTNYNRKILDQKRWAIMTTPAPVATSAGVFVISSNLWQQLQLYVVSATTHYLYHPLEDAYIQIPSGALAGTFGAGSCGVSSPIGPSGTASGGSYTTVATTLTLLRGLAGYKIEIMSGPGAGDVRTIKYNDIGANAVVTVDEPFSAVITNASTFRILTPRFYVLNAGTLASGSFKVYCYALNTWITLTQANLPATVGTDGRLIATPSYGANGDAITFASGTATSATLSTLVNSAKAWTTNQWANYQVKIVAGTGVGQVRTIASNTSTTLTVSVAWTTTPNATSQYAIQGNDDYLYFLGNNAVAMYRYSISANTWTVLAPTAARAAAPGAAFSGHWVYGCTDDRWTAENAIINGRRIYSLRGGASAVMDYYDIALNTWVSGVPFSPGVETVTTGTKYAYIGDYLYIHKDATGRWFRYSFPEQSMAGWSTNVYAGGAAVVGDTAFDLYEPSTGVRFIYMILNTSSIVMRCLIV